MSDQINPHNIQSSEAAETISSVVGSQANQTSASSTPTFQPPPPPIVPEALVVHLFLGREAGGITSSIGQWIPAQQEVGWRHVCLALRADGAIVEEMRRFGVDAVIAGNGRGIPTRQRFGSQLRQELIQLNPAIIHAHNPATQFYGVWNRPKGKKNADRVWRMVRTVHADTSLEMKHNLSLAGRLFWNAASAWAMRRTEGIICIHDHVRANLAPSIHAKTVVIPNGLNPALIEDSRASLPTDLRNWLGDDQTPMVLSIGRLVEIKRFDWLIRAWSESAIRQRARLVLLGRGSQYEHLKRLINDLKLHDSVRLEPWTSEIAPILKRANLTVVTSRSETGPLVLLESMAASVPTVSTPVGFVSDVLLDGETGRIIPHPADSSDLTTEDIQQLASTFDDLLSDPDRLHQMGRSARLRLSQTADHIASARQTAELYNMALGAAITHA